MYKVIRNIVSKELTEFCYNYLCTKNKVVKFFNKINYIPREFVQSLDGKEIEEDIGWGRWNDGTVSNTYSVYGDLVMETLLTKIQPIMEVETETQLYPTYSYARLYKNNDILERHKDRPSCKIATTLNLGGDPWPISLEPSGEEGKQGVNILLKPGDMLIYDGSALEHWREAFKGKICGQVFLHYSAASLENTAKNRYDNRPFLGLPPTFIGFKLNDNHNRS